MGGGTYSSTGSLNHGIYLQNAVLTSSGAGATTMNLTGLAGQGTGGTNAGVYITGSGLNLNFGTNTNNQLNFLNCIGGFVGSNNYGVFVGGPVATLSGNALTQFLNATGGGNGAGTNNHGLYFAANFSAPDVVAEATGGFGFGTVGNGNYGVYVGSGVVVGGAGANQVSFAGSSLGTGSGEYGINAAGTIQVGNGGAINLKGTGGGLYNGAGSHNFGVELAGATLSAGGGGTAVNVINVSGFGGVGSGGNHYGVDISTSLVLNLNGTNNNSAVNFGNCSGGPGGGSNFGINIATPVNLASGSLNFLNVTGGGNPTSGSNIGLNVGATVTAPGSRAEILWAVLDRAATMV